MIQSQVVQFSFLGQLNRWHSHALPAQSRSLPHLAFIGEEPLAQDGASVSWLAPFQGAGTWQATVEITRSRNEALFGESRGVSVLGNVNAFWQLSDTKHFERWFAFFRPGHQEGVVPARIKELARLKIAELNGCDT